uniref:Velvet domain-containing protein n=1 Tax=Mycena chlorophos TaxID=658473 RepID=A0ABQ0LNS6_MYCCL|nr:predicted protein [Mycena chlorophos]
MTRILGALLPPTWKGTGSTHFLFLLQIYDNQSVPRVDEQRAYAVLDCSGESFTASVLRIVAGWQLEKQIGFARLRWRNGTTRGFIVAISVPQALTRPRRLTRETAPRKAPGEAGPNAKLEIRQWVHRDSFQAIFPLAPRLDESLVGLSLKYQVAARCAGAASGPTGAHTTKKRIRAPDPNAAAYYAQPGYPVGYDTDYSGVGGYHQQSAQYDPGKCIHNRNNNPH